MKAVGLTEVKVNPDNVSGLSTDAIAAITFLRCGKVFNSITMVAGSDLSHTKTILNKVLTEMPKHIPNL